MMNSFKSIPFDSVDTSTLHKVSHYCNYGNDDYFVSPQIIGRKVYVVDSNGKKAFVCESATYFCITDSALSRDKNPKHNYSCNKTRYLDVYTETCNPDNIYRQLTSEDNAYLNKLISCNTKCYSLYGSNDGHYLPQSNFIISGGRYGIGNMLHFKDIIGERIFLVVEYCYENRNYYGITKHYGTHTIVCEKCTDDRIDVVAAVRSSWDKEFPYRGNDSGEYKISEVKVYVDYKDVSQANDRLDVLTKQLYSTESKLSETACELSTKANDLAQLENEIKEREIELAKLNNIFRVREEIDSIEREIKEYTNLCLVTTSFSVKEEMSKVIEQKKKKLSELKA